MGNELLNFLTADLPKALGMDSSPDPQSVERGVFNSTLCPLLDKSSQQSRTTPAVRDLLYLMDPFSLCDPWCFTHTDARKNTFTQPHMTALQELTIFLSYYH